MAKESVKIITLTSKHLFFAGAIIIAAVALLLFALRGESSTNNVLQPGSGGTQAATLSVKNYEFILQPYALQANVPVRMMVDLNTVQGCLRSVVIPEFGVRKLVSEGDNIITFTPTKTGTFTIMCSMGMGRGSFKVV